MREIGGYIELDTYRLPMLHQGAKALNCGRNALAWLIRARGIRRIRLPRFLCSSVEKVCRKEEVSVRYYSVGFDLLPDVTELADDEWLYLVNYYGQLTNAKIESYARCFSRVIVDNAQAYFQMPVPRVDTLYTCRKFFGVPDGAFLYSDAELTESLPMDESFERMHFLLGRFERPASEFYSEYVENNHFFETEPIKRMSRLTENLLHGIDYADVRRRREDNYDALHSLLGVSNELRPERPDGPFMYPYYTEDGKRLRQLLQKEKIYIPTLWPDVFALCKEQDDEYRMAENILPLPVDQRYTGDDMGYICERIFAFMKG